MTYELRVALLSDALFGAGHGIAGGADVVATLEPDTGLPYVRGRTLKGLLVEACADLLRSAADAGGPGLGRLEAAARSLFGVPGSDAGARAEMRVGAARLPDPVREAVREALGSADRGAITRDDVVEGLTVVRRQTAVDDTGAPAEGSLRSARLAARGIELRASLRFDAPPSDDAVALLSACARAVQRGGGHRTRGMGRLATSLWAGDRDLSAAARDAFGAVLSGGAPPALPRPPQPAPPDGAPAVAPIPDAPEGAVALRYRLHFEEPLLVRGLDGDPNSAVGLDHVPGTTLRGAFVGRYLQERRSRQERGPVDLAADAEARALFFDGTVRFLPAYPVAEGRRTLPTPRSWAHAKGDDGDAVDFAVDPGRLDEEGVQWRRPRAQFAGRAAALLSPDRLVSVHIQRSRRARVTAANDDRAVFRYDALAAGQTFEGVVLCADGPSAAAARPWLEGPVSLGGTSTAGYGACTLSFVEAVPLEAFAEAPDEAPARGTGPVTLTLSSPLLLRDPSTGLHTTAPGALEAAIAAATGRPARVVRAFAGGVVVGGFNRKWGLPLPQRWAVAAGSVFVLEADAGALRPLEASGLGDRVAEGFGRVVLDRLSRGRLELRVPDAPPPARAGGRALEGSSAAVARRILTARLARTLDRLVLARALELSALAPLPTRSQLARLRLLLRSALDQSPADAERRVDAFLRGLPQKARGQLERARLGGGSLLEWLAARARGDGDLHALLGYAPVHAPSLGGLTAAPGDDDARRLHLRLALATVTLAAKRRPTDA